MLYSNYINSLVNNGSTLLKTIDYDDKNLNLKNFKPLLDDDEADIDKVILYCGKFDKNKCVIRVKNKDVDAYYKNDLLVSMFLQREALMKNITPNIIFTYLYNDDAQNDSKCMTKVYNNRRKITDYNIRPVSSSLISIVQYIESGTLENWIEEVCINDYVSPETWYKIMFQITYTLAVLYKKFKFIHNDLVPCNILMDEECPQGANYLFTYNDKKYLLKECNIIPKLIDFEISIIETNTNNKIENKYITENKTMNEIGASKDLHYLLNSLIMVDDMFNEKILPPPLKQAILELYKHGKFLNRCIKEQGDIVIIDANEDFIQNYYIKNDVAVKYSLPTAETFLNNPIFDRFLVNETHNEIIDEFFSL
jgi:serine/threonine protein kinase